MLSVNSIASTSKKDLTEKALDTIKNLLEPAVRDYCNALKSILEMITELEMALSNSN